MSLTDQTIVVIGAGNMGGAILSGAVAAKVVDPEKVTAVDLDEALLATHRSNLGIGTATDASDVIACADLVVLALKPQVWRKVVARFADRMAASQMVLSIMAGVTTDAIGSALPDGVPVVRCMPNLLAQVGEGAAAITGGTHAEDKHLAAAEALLGAVGMTVRVDESQMDAVTGLSGSGPAFVFVLIDALADGGVQAGLPRPVALELATQTVLGSAKMVQETKDSPAVLKERVTSPGGTTIAGIRALEEGGFRAALMAAVQEAAKRSKELSGS